jgi:hypothetical protein
MFARYLSSLKMYEENLLDHRAALPEKYVYISSPPGYSHITYCPPSQPIVSPSPLSAAALRTHLVVVKIRRLPKITNEHSALVTIASTTSPSSDLAKHHFLSCLSVSGLDGAPELSFTTITLPAVLPSVTLGDWCNAAAETENPVVFVYHVSISLGTALQFLRRECATEHADVHDGNVLLRVREGSPFGLPELVIVDFELQKRGDVGVSRDYFDALMLVHLLAQEVEDGDRIWKDFKQAVALMVLDRKAQAERRLEASRFEEFWEEWKGAAIGGRNEASTEAVAVTREIYWKAVEQKGEFVTDEDLERAVQGVNSP